MVPFLGFIVSFLWGALRSLLSIVRIRRRTPFLGVGPIPSPVYRPVLTPTTSGTPSAPVHALQLSPSVASSGQTVQATLLDQSLDFTLVNPSLFNIFLHVPIPPGSTGVIYHVVPVFSFLSAQVLEFEVPPVGSAPLTPGAYIVLCRYGFWSVESNDVLTLT